MPRNYLNLEFFSYASSCRATDPVFIKVKKLELLGAVCMYESVPQISSELRWVSSELLLFCLYNQWKQVIVVSVSKWTQRDTCQA